MHDSNGGLVSVQIQYRLGLFGKDGGVCFPQAEIEYLLGFLSGEKVKEGGSLNVGLRGWLL